MRNNAALPATTGPVIRISQLVRVHGQVCVNTLDYMGTGAAVPDTTALLLIADTWQTNYGADYLACMSQDASWFGYYVSLISHNTTPTGVLMFGAARPGTVAAASLPTDVCITLSRYAAVRGQHGIGRVLLPGVPTSFVTPAADPNSLNAAGVTAVTPFKNDLRAIMTIAGVQWAPVISTRPIAPATTVTRAGLVAASVVRTILGTCRRRREGRGI